MQYTIKTILMFILSSLIPVVVSIILYLLEKKAKFKNTNYWYKQIIIGIIYGLLAILLTNIGINVNGANLNVRDACPLIAGLIFGGPAGIIAGIIGGVYRFFYTYISSLAFSQIACSLACVLAGILGALCRKFMFNNKKPSGTYGFAIGAVMETIHMLLIFITNMNDVFDAYSVVAICAIPMIIANSASVMLSLLFIKIIGKEGMKVSFKNKKIAHIFQVMLLFSVVFAYVVTSMFTYDLQTKIALAEATNLLKLNLEDLEKDVKETSNENLLSITRNISKKTSISSSKEELEQLVNDYNIIGINIVSKDGIIITSTNDDFVNFNMASGTQSSEFLCLLNGEKEYVQDYMPLSYDSTIYRKYAGVAFDDGGFVQVGYDASLFQKDITDEIMFAVKNRHIGQEGGIIVCNEKFEILSDNGSHDGDLEYEVDQENAIEAQPYSTFVVSIGNTKSYCMYVLSEGYYLIANIPVDEAMFSRNIAVTILSFMEIIVFASLFVNIYFLLKKIIVNNIYKINKSLALISEGNLDVHVDVRETEEFISLSDDINATVDTLKRYIDEAEKRIDRELEFARQIQHSSLPSVFPPYPDIKIFDIYASMDCAKEVGGDFYDFYLLDQKHLVFIVADVSGKGIPAALFMMRAKTMIKSLVETGKPIDEVMTKANMRLCENNDAEMFVTAWLGILDLETGNLEYVNAGHNPPLIRTNGGKYEYLKSKPNFILAGMKGLKYQKHEIKLAPNDEIFLYTDGVTEASDTNDKFYGEARLQEILSNTHGDAKSICKAVKDDINNFTLNALQSDDITMLAIKLNLAPCTIKKESISVYPANASIEKVNNFISDTLKKWEMNAKTSNKIQIAVDELYSNIVYYSKAKNVTVSIESDDNNITLNFEDDGILYDPTKAKEPDVTKSLEDREVGGLGIFMVKKMATSIKYNNINGKNILIVVYNIEK